MPLEPVENRRLYRQIADQIASLIQKGRYRLGDRLPPERDLARQLAVSRPSVREALIALEVEGYVEVRVGSGVYVVGSHPARMPAQPLPADSGPFELIRARWLIEAECAALAARHATRGQIRGMEEALERMRSGGRDGPALAADRLFHQRIGEASGNSALALVVKTLWDQRTGPLFLRLEHHFDTSDLWDAAIREHREILQAIARHDAAAARATMRRHMNQAARRFSASWAKGKDAAGEPETRKPARGVRAARRPR